MLLQVIRRTAISCHVVQADKVEDCLPHGQKLRYIGLTMFYQLYLRARDRIGTAEYQRERFRCRAIAQGTFASLDRLSWSLSRLRGLWKSLPSRNRR